MKLTALNTFTFLFIISFLFANVSGGWFTGLAPAIESIFKTKIPSSIARVIPGKSNLDKGMFVKGKLGDISDVNDYLEKYGYLNSSTSNPNSIDESSLIQYQKFFNLTPTGQFDNNTYNILTKPRCGVADIVNETSSFKPWWTGNELKYGFHPKNKVSNNVKSLFQDAFNRWSNVTGLNFTETVVFNKSNIRIGFLNFDGKGGMVGGSYINNNNNVGIMFFDLKEQWVNKSDIKKDEVDLESAVMHQIGHLLGLEHSSVEESIMYPIVLPKQKIELVNDDDLKKIQQIYDVKNVKNGASDSNVKTDASGSSWSVGFWPLGFFGFVVCFVGLM
ncbi:metalloendoproteinase 1-like [Vicia villosa]|uniref:metalloendoproteinase 1-like n=1 Tax=Vicia villosa TaxID=3911 RepID=UPI00273AFD94|nr:metalloendoproteinase 1-like [Vicia villosa]